VLSVTTRSTYLAGIYVGLYFGGASSIEHDLNWNDIETMKRWIVALHGWVTMDRPHLFGSTCCRNASMGTNIRTPAHLPPPRPMITASCHNSELSTRLPPLNLKRNHVPHPCSNLCLIIDLAGKSRAPTSVAQAKLFVEILGNHYPERLGSVSRRLLVHVHGD
jgi:hypothetical protein